METKRVIHLLIKIFNKESYADAFLKKGQLYCNSLEYFRKLESNDGRGDNLEGAVFIYQPKDISPIEILKPNTNEVLATIKQNELRGPVIGHNNNLDFFNLYCMYAVHIQNFEKAYETEEEKNKIINELNKMYEKAKNLDDEMLSFGDYSVVIFRVSEFINRVKKIAGINLIYHNLVDYYDATNFSGEFTTLQAIFKKDKKYAYQQEYRFLFDFNNKKIEAREICIGSISDIAFKIQTRDINKKIVLKSKNN